MGAVIFYTSFLHCSPGLLSWWDFLRQSVLQEQDSEAGWRGVWDTLTGLALASMALQHSGRVTQYENRAAQTGSLPAGEDEPANFLDTLPSSPEHGLGRRCPPITATQGEGCLHQFQMALKPSRQRHRKGSKSYCYLSPHRLPLSPSVCSLHMSPPISYFSCKLFRTELCTMGL